MGLLELFDRLEKFNAPVFIELFLPAGLGLPSPGGSFSQRRRPTWTDAARYFSPCGPRGECRESTFVTVVSLIAASRSGSDWRGELCRAAGRSAMLEESGKPTRRDVWAFVSRGSVYFSS